MVEETIYNRMGTLAEPFHTLISAAILAPSGDNTQPWRFEIDEAASTITICVDETRDTSPMNANQRMARIACGAATENIVQTAVHNGWEWTIKLHDDPLRVATLHVASHSSKRGKIPETIIRRHTNRQPYAAAPHAESLDSRLHVANPNQGGVEVIWVVKRESIRKIAIAIGRADAEMFGRSAFLKAFLANVCFDLPPNSAPEQGLCVGSLELSAFERLLLPFLSYAPGRLISSRLTKHAFQTKAAKLVNGTSGLCLIVTRSSEPVADFQVGRLMQRAWLKLTEIGYQAQPMMSIPVLANAAGQWAGPVRSLEEVLNISHFDPFRGLAQYVPAAILRFGRAAPATARTGRRQLAQVIQTQSSLVPAGA